MPIIRNPRLKAVVTIHDLGAEFLEQYHKFPSKIYLNWSTNFSVRFANHLIAVSDATKRDIEGGLGLSQREVTDRGCKREIRFG
jgi:hypothetical protein